MPAAVYVRGYVTEYARALRLDPQRAAASYLTRYRRRAAPKAPRSVGRLTSRGEQLALHAAASGRAERRRVSTLEPHRGQKKSPEPTVGWFGACE